MRKLLFVWMALSMILTLSAPAMAETAPKSDDIVILYINDVHTYIDNNAGEENADDLPTISADSGYDDVTSSGRITMCEKMAEDPVEKPAAKAAYTIRWGDTLWALSRKYGCTINDIVASNSG